MRLVLALIILLALPSTAAAAELSLELDPPDGTRWGEAQAVAGKLTDDAGAPLAGQPVTLQGRAYPYEGAYEDLQQVTTDAEGGYRFSQEFDRNIQLRVQAPGAQVTSEQVAAYVFPSLRLAFKAIDERRVRLTQTYRVPKGVRLKRSTLFYVGARGGDTAPVAGTGTPRRVRDGLYRARVTVRIRKAWNGRFQYATCFRYTEGSGMGDPKSRCPQRYRF